MTRLVSDSLRFMLRRMLRVCFFAVVLCCFNSCSSGPRTVTHEDGTTYIELSMLEEVSITRTRDPEIEFPAQAVILGRQNSLLSALQKLYPDYWFSEFASLPDGEFDVAIIPRDGLVLDLEQQRSLLKRAFENSFKVRIQVDDENKVATIKGRLL